MAQKMNYGNSMNGNSMNEEITPTDLMAVSEMGQEQDAVLNEMASPMGDFSKKGLNALVGSYNAIAEMFGQSPDYPMFSEGAEVLPEDFVAALMMVEAAVTEAVAAGVLSEEMGFSLSEVADDGGLKVLAGKIASITKSQPFIAFMREGGMGMEEEVPEGMHRMPDGSLMSNEEMEAPAEDVDALFASRV